MLEEMKDYFNAFATMNELAGYQRVNRKVSIRIEDDKIHVLKNTKVAGQGRDATMKILNHIRITERDNKLLIDFLIHETDKTMLSLFKNLEAFCDKSQFDELTIYKFKFIDITRAIKFINDMFVNILYVQEDLVRKHFESRQR